MDKNIEWIKQKSESVCEEFCELNEWIQKADKNSSADYILRGIAKVNSGLGDLFYAVEKMEEDHG